ncbi:hypothetical protein MY1884_006622, partial [Beauveria asiatica]
QTWHFVYATRSLERSGRCAARRLERISEHVQRLLSPQSHRYCSKPGKYTVCAGEASRCSADVAMGIFGPA